MHACIASSKLMVEDRMSSRLFSLLVRFGFVFEPISSRFVSFFLGRKLKEWKNKRLIGDYKTKTRRIGKFHYKIYVDLDVTPKQASRILRDTLIQALKRIRR
jgi:hypothetical protein